MVHRAFVICVGCIFRATALESIALVGEDSVAGLREVLQTNWTLLTYESQPTPEKLSQVAFVVSGWYPTKISQCSNNKVLQLPYTGYDHLNFSLLPSTWTVANVHQAGTPIAEYVLSNMLSWNIGQAKVEADFRECTWNSKPPGNTCTHTARHREIYGQTLGIVGYGSIGRAIASRAAAFGMNVWAVDQKALSPLPAPLSWMGDDAQLQYMMSRSDFVVIAVPLFPSTRNMINASNLAVMKKSAVLINIARGPVVSETDLFDALQGKRIGGAVLDVWWHDFQWLSPGGTSPADWPAAHDFTILDNVVMTPHFSAETLQSRLDSLRQVAANMDHFQRGEPLDNVVRNGTQQTIFA